MVKRIKKFFKDLNENFRRIELKINLVLSMCREIKVLNESNTHQREQYYFETEDYTNSQKWMKSMTDSVGKTILVFCVELSDNKTNINIKNIGLCMGYGINVNNVFKEDGVLETIVKKYVIIKNKSSEDMQQIILEKNDIVKNQADYISIGK